MALDSERGGKIPISWSTALREGWSGDPPGLVMKLVADYSPASRSSRTRTRSSARSAQFLRCAAVPHWLSPPPRRPALSSVRVSANAIRFLSPIAPLLCAAGGATGAGPLSHHQRGFTVLSAPTRFALSSSSLPRPAPVSRVERHSRSPCAHAPPLSRVRHSGRSGKALWMVRRRRRPSARGSDRWPCAGGDAATRLRLLLPIFPLPLLLLAPPISHV